MERKPAKIYPTTRNPADTGLTEREIRALETENTGSPDSRMSAIRKRADDITPEQLLAEFARWHIWIGLCGIRYARRSLTSPPAIVRGEDWTALRDEIRGWEGTHTRR
jgi:hypothetical protein